MSQAPSGIQTQHIATGMGTDYNPAKKHSYKEYRKGGTGAEIEVHKSLAELLPTSQMKATKPVPYGITSGLSSAGMGVKEISAPISLQHTDKIHDAIHAANTKVIKTDTGPEAKMPFMTNAQTMSLGHLANSPHFDKLLKSTSQQAQDKSGLSNTLIDSIANMGKKPTGAHKRYAKNIATENTINRASNQLIGANNNFYKTIELQCPHYSSNRVCIDFANMQNKFLDNKFEEIFLNNFEIQSKIVESIKLNDEEKMAVLRLEELLATRMEELSKLEQEINKLSTDKCKYKK